MKDVLAKHKQIWQNKPILRKVYYRWYKMIVSDLVPGKTVELGAGTGNFKEYKLDVITADIEEHDWLDMCFDAHDMPFDDGSINNLVLIDVLHHLADPARFLLESGRVLAPGGRLIMLEPYPSLFSHFIYKRFHPEPFIFDVDYFKSGQDRHKDPWDSNQAIPYLLFFRDLEKFQTRFSNIFSFKRKELLSFILYPATGGFEGRQLIPTWSAPAFQFIELLLTPFARLLAFRCYIVLEKTS